MHLRLPIACALVVVAAGAAVFRGVVGRHGEHPAVSTGPALAAAGAPPSPSATDAPRRRPARGIVVYVAGDVNRPGLYTLAPAARANDAVAAAGGARSDADLVAVNLAASLADGDEIAVYARGSAPGTRAHRAAGAAHATARRARAHAPKRARRKRAAASGAADDASIGPDEPLDLNAADATELATLPGIGPGLAERIVVVRETSGPFASLDDLLDVGGMSVAKIDALAPFVTLR